MTFPMYRLQGGLECFHWCVFIDISPLHGKAAALAYHETGIGCNQQALQAPVGSSLACNLGGTIALLKQ